MKIVLVTPRLVPVDGHDEVRECCDREWGRLLASAGFLGLAATGAAPVSELCSLPGLAGVVLSGGNDLSTVSDSPLSRQRDEFETKLLRECAGSRIPVLGVCRGAQLMLSESGAGLESVKGHAGTSHHLDWTAVSRLGEYCGHCPAVKSYHDWAIAGVPAGWTLSAWAADGTLEALEHDGLPWWAVMWHPEREHEARDVYVNLLKRIFI